MRVTMVPEDAPEEALAKLAKSAERAAKLAAVCLVVAVLVLAIDNRLKKHIIEEGRKALALLDEARKLAEEARAGGPVWASREDGAAAGAGVDAGDGVVHAAGASAAPGADARRGARKPSGGAAGEG